MNKNIKHLFLHKTHDLLFKSIHQRQLIYNASWEDPRIDRQLLALDDSSEVVVLTSAGCNVLDYILDEPAAIHAVDVNPRQNALLNLKLALIKRGRFDDLFEMFGKGAHASFREIYAEVRPCLNPGEQKFWDKKIDYFDKHSNKKSFYYYGTSGLLAWLITRYLGRNRELRNKMFNIFDTQNLAQQKRIFEEMEPMIWGGFISWIVRQPAVLMLAGVPRPQVRLIQTQYPGGIGCFISDKLRHVFTEILVHDNYFWRVYITGSYSTNCCPNYLKQENFDTMQRNAARIKSYNNSISGFLDENPGTYSHFVLLDHQDWLAQHDPLALDEEWQLILANSRPGTKILMRSAATRITFLPEFVSQAIRFFPEQTLPLHVTDRVGTYGSLHFAEVI